MQAYKISADFPGLNWYGTVILNDGEDLIVYLLERFNKNRVNVGIQEKISLNQVNIIDLTVSDFLKILNNKNETVFKFKDAIKFKFKCSNCNYLTNDKNFRCVSCGHHGFIENK